MSTRTKFASLFIVFLYSFLMELMEGYFFYFLMFVGIIRSPVTRQDEIHNCQVVIDTLGSEVLHTNLAHINGRAIIEGSREAVSNLLEIYSGLLEYILNKIESDISTDNEGEYECRTRAVSENKVFKTV